MSTVLEQPKQEVVKPKPQEDLERFMPTITEIPLPEEPVVIPNFTVIQVAIEKSLERLTTMARSMGPVHSRTVTGGITEVLLGEDLFTSFFAPVPQPTVSSRTKVITKEWKSKITPMLQKIAPKWYAKIQDEQENKPSNFMLQITRLLTRGQLDISNYSMCIVGEAHGFDDSYTSTCGRCDGYSERIGKYAKEDNVDRFVYNVNKFVDHFENVHFNRGA